MTTDTEINERVALALGWRRVAKGECFSTCAWESPEQNSHNHRNHYEAGAVDKVEPPNPGWRGAGWAFSVDACVRDLVPEARSRGWCLSMEDEGDTFHVYFARSRNDPEERTGSTPTFGDSVLARAICLAWLKTRELDAPPATHCPRASVVPS